MSRPVSGKLVDGLFRRVLGPELPPSLRAKLAEGGLDLSLATLAPEYPRALVFGSLELTAATLYEGLPPPEQQRKLGLRVMAALAERHVISGAWLSLARLWGPRRSLRQAAEHLDRSAVKLSVVERSRTELEVAVEDAQLPEFLAGLLEGAIDLLGGRAARTAVVGPRENATIFSASWR